MAIARDASSPARVTTVSTAASVGPDTATTAAFNPPADSWFYLTQGVNQVGPNPVTFDTPINTGNVLSWTLVGSSLTTASNGGGVVVWRAYNASAQVGITVKGSVTYAAGGAGAGSSSSAMHLDVWTGCNTSQTGAAVSTSQGTTQSNNPSVSTTATGSRVAAGQLDWAATGDPTSTDTTDSYTIAGQTSGARVYKASNSGAPGSVSVNIVAGGASPINSFIVYEILPGPIAPVINTQPQSLAVYAGQTANFSTSATASAGALHYQWKDNGSNVGTDSNSYSFTSAQGDDQSLITVDVTDDNGTITSDTAILTVYGTAAIAWFIA